MPRSPATAHPGSALGAQDGSLGRDDGSCCPQKPLPEARVQEAPLGDPPPCPIPGARCLAPRVQLGAQQSSVFTQWSPAGSWPPARPPSMKGSLAPRGAWPQPLRQALTLPVPSGNLRGEPGREGQATLSSQGPPNLGLPAPARAWGDTQLPSWRLLLAPERTFQLLSQTPTFLCALKPDNTETCPTPASPGHLRARKGRAGVAWLELQDQSLGRTEPRALQPPPGRQQVGQRLWAGSPRRVSPASLRLLRGEAQVRGQPEAG